MTNEGKPMIENSDRGITIAKPLAWSILVSLVAVVWFGGSTVSSLSTSTQAVTAALSAMQASNISIESRVRALENNAATALARFEALAAGLGDLKDGQREMQGLLRETLQKTLQGRTP